MEVFVEKQYHLIDHLITSWSKQAIKPENLEYKNQMEKIILS